MMDGFSASQVNASTYSVIYPEVPGISNTPLTRPNVNKQPNTHHKPISLYLSYCLNKMMDRLKNIEMKPTRLDSING